MTGYTLMTKLDNSLYNLTFSATYIVDLLIPTTNRDSYYTKMFKFLCYIYLKISLYDSNCHPCYTAPPPPPSTIKVALLKESAHKNTHKFNR